MTRDTHRSDPRDDEPQADTEPKHADDPERSDDPVRRRLHDLAVANDCGPDIDPATGPDDRPRT